MHHIMGYSWDEIMAMVTIFSTVGGGLIWLLHLAIKSGTEGLSKAKLNSSTSTTSSPTQ